jgi:hypothetical protein
MGAVQSHGLGFAQANVGAADRSAAGDRQSWDRKVVPTSAAAVSLSQGSVWIAHSRGLVPG